MAYTTIDKPSDYFNTVLRSGLYGGSDTAFTVGFQPDWIWDKRRSDTSVHALFDSVRGFGASGKVLYSNTTGAEADNALIKSVSSTGFTITASSDNTGTLVDWCWKKTADAGFNIVGYSGTGSTATVSHGLGVVPSLIILKCRTNANPDWIVFGKVLGGTVGSEFAKLNNTGAKTTGLDTSWFNQTAPTSSVFTVGTQLDVNASSNTYIAYCFADVQGYSKFGSYTGNGNNDGTFVYTGFKPAFVMVKNTAISEQWSMHDNKRNDNVIPNYARLVADDSQVEATNTTFAKVELLSNGFKLGNSADVINDASVKFIFMAFAEQPFVTSTGVPTTAR